MRADLTERVLRGLYSAALYVLVPITLYHLIWRGFRQRAYFHRWSERYANYPERGPSAPLWLHAVSVGEVNAAAPLVDRLRQLRPDLRLVITTITPTGSERVRTLWGDAVTHVYLPYDLPGAVGRFLDHFRPALALILRGLGIGERASALGRNRDEETQQSLLADVDRLAGSGAGKMGDLFKVLAVGSAPLALFPFRQPD